MYFYAENLKRNFEVWKTRRDWGWVGGRLAQESWVCRQGEENKKVEGER